MWVIQSDVLKFGNKKYAKLEFTKSMNQFKVEWIIEFESNKIIL